MTIAHTGHVDGFGIQAHSCGPLMPWMIRGVGDSWQAFNGSTGVELRRHAYDNNIPGDLIRAHRLAVLDAEMALAADRMAEKFELAIGWGIPNEKLAA